MTKQEVVLWNQIRNKKMGVKFRRQYPINSKYIADFVCLEKKLIIEVDGGQHCNAKSDEVRTFYLENLGFTGLGFWENEIDKNLAGCVEYLKNFLQANLSSPLAGEVGEAHRGVCLKSISEKTPFCPSGTFSPQRGQTTLSSPLVGEVPKRRRGVPVKAFYGYAGWNTSANTLGSLLAGVKIKYNASKYNENAFKKLQMIRFLDDWAYQSNVRGQIEKPCDIKDLIRPYEETLSEIFDYKISNQITYAYPWNRKFEIEVDV